MRRPIIVGNWKMHTIIAEASTLITTLEKASVNFSAVQVVVAPPYTALSTSAKLCKTLHLCAQELFYESKGAYTGAISGDMLKDVGCEYVLVGHSERRQYFAETLESSKKRVDAALKANLKPILCIGETLQEREQHQTETIVLTQLKAATDHLDSAQWALLTIAYEPVWAIGTGKVATTSEAQTVHAFIRKHLPENVRDTVSILYGGSVKPNNAEALMAEPDIDGLLVGGASLEAKDFLAIIEAAKPKGSYEQWFDHQFKA